MIFFVHYFISFIPCIPPHCIAFIVLYAFFLYILFNWRCALRFNLCLVMVLGVFFLSCSCLTIIIIIIYDLIYGYIWFVSYQISMTIHSTFHIHMIWLYFTIVTITTILIAGHILVQHIESCFVFIIYHRHSNYVRLLYWFWKSSIGRSLY